MESPPCPGMAKVEIRHVSDHPFVHIEVPFSCTHIFLPPYPHDPLPNSGLFQPKQETVADFTAVEEESTSLGSLSLHRLGARRLQAACGPGITLLFTPRLLLLPQLMTCTFKVVL